MIFYFSSWLLIEHRGTVFYISGVCGACTMYRATNDCSALQR